MEKIVKQIVRLYPDINEDEYRKQFIMLYGALDVICSTTDDIMADILLIEKKRLLEGQHEFHITPSEFIYQYSNISLFLAKERWFNKRILLVSSLLQDIFYCFLDGKSLGKNEKLQFKRLISEINLDFKYASGNSSFCSLRMKQIIQQTH